MGASAVVTEAAESVVTSRIILRPSVLDKQTANFSKTLQGGSGSAVHLREKTLCDKVSDQPTKLIPFDRPHCMVEGHLAVHFIIGNFGKVPHDFNSKALSWKRLLRYYYLNIF